MHDLLDKNFWNAYTPILVLLTIIFTICLAPLLFFRSGCPTNVSAYIHCQLGYYFGKWYLNRTFGNPVDMDIGISALLSMTSVFIYHVMQKKKQKTKK